MFHILRFLVLKKLFNTYLMKRFIYQQYIWTIEIRITKRDVTGHRNKFSDEGLKIKSNLDMFTFLENKKYLNNISFKKAYWFKQVILQLRKQIFQSYRDQHSESQVSIDFAFSLWPNRNLLTSNKMNPYRFRVIALHFSNCEVNSSYCDCNVVNREKNAKQFFHQGEFKSFTLYFSTLYPNDV